jgi:cell division protein FtsQ
VHLRYKLGFGLLALLAGYVLWLALLRNLSLFQVQSVTVSGLSGGSAPQIDATLELTAREMTTTNFSAGRLRAAVASYSSVAGLSVHTGFPHAVRIDVVERRPLARLDYDGSLLAVARHDRVLSGLAPSKALPLVRSTRSPLGDRVTYWLTRAELTVLAAAPRPLWRRVYSIREGSEGLTVRLRDGPLLYFGDDSLVHAKWDSASVVLASPTSRGARYIDVSLPGRPAAAVGDPLTSPVSAGSQPSAAVATLVGAGSSSTSG